MIVKKPTQSDSLCFCVHSNTGKRLMAKCRLLYQENEELGRMINSGRLAKLEGDLALQKSFSEEVKKSQSGKDQRCSLLCFAFSLCMQRNSNFFSMETCNQFQKAVM